MENQQTTETPSQNQPLNNTETGNNGNSAAKLRDARINKIKQKFLPGFKITLLLSLALYIAMLVVGILGVHKCPVEQNIPLFLIATGAIGLITKITTYMRERILRHFEVKYVESSLYTVETVFLILGAFWVYKEYPPNYDPSFGIYCQKSAYLFAFIYITIILVAIGLSLLAMLMCCLCCLYCAAKVAGCVECDVESQENDNDEAEDVKKDKDKETEKVKEEGSKST